MSLNVHVVFGMETWWDLNGVNASDLRDARHPRRNGHLRQGDGRNRPGHQGTGTGTGKTEDVKLSNYPWIVDVAGGGRIIDKPFVLDAMPLC